MTIEEFIAKEYNSNTYNGGYVVNPEEVKEVRFEASPSHVYSEWTSESFSCTIHFMHAYRKLSVFLDEEEVCKMLNELFPSKG